MDVLSCLKSFTLLVRYKNFSTAASLLQISTSKISKQMSWLEQYFGKKIFIRSTRQFVLSDFGKVLYPKAIKFIEDATQLKEVTSETEKAPTNLQLYISATPIVPYLTELNLAFLRSHAHINLRVVVGADLANGPEERTNLIVSFNGSKQPHLYTGKLFEIQRSVFAAPDYLKKNKSIKKVEDLLEHNCMINTLYGLQDRWILGNQVIQVAGNLQSNNAALLLQAAIAGFGLIWVPGFTIAEDLKRGRLVPVLEKAVSPIFTIYYSYSRFVDGLDSVKSLIQFYQERFKQDYF